jgi:hypothetical protein
MQILDYKAHGIRVLSATVCHGVANQRLCHAFTLLARCQVPQLAKSGCDLD